MDDIVVFLRDENNRQLLSFLGAGIAAVATAIWAIIRHFSGGRKSENSTSGATSNFNLSDNTGIIAGGNVVSSGSISIGYGTRAFLLFAILLGIFLLVAPFVASRFITGEIRGGQLPYFALTLSCGSEENPHRLSEAEVKTVDDFFSFVEANEDKVFRFSVDMELTCNQCECYRTRAFDPNSFDDTSPGYLEINATPLSERVQLSDVTKNGIELLAFGGEWANSMFIYIPNYSQIPNNGFYEREIAGVFAYYSGPFRANADDNTGFFMSILEPIQQPDEELRAKLICEMGDASFWQRIYYTCW